MSSLIFKIGSKLGIGCGMFASALVLSACSVNSDAFEPFDVPLNSEFSVKAKDIILTVPDVEEREQYQMVIARLTQILATEQLTPEQRAQILYQLGILYDRLGMSVTARNMFMNALIEVPDYASVYNFVGSYLAASERFSEAYDAFDAVLEIDPNESYAYFNRGIALYYGKRAKLGVEDLLKFYSFDKNDPFRIAWLYILEREVYGKQYAVEHMAERRSKIGDDVPWGIEILDFMSGEVDSNQLINTIRYADIPKVEKSRRLCEAYFYMAKMAEFEGEFKLAYDLLHLCVSTEVTGYLEYRYALMEINRFERQEMIAKANQVATRMQEERENLLKLQTKEAQRFFDEANKQSPLVMPPKVEPDAKSKESVEELPVLKINSGDSGSDSVKNTP